MALRNWENLPCGSTIVCRNWSLSRPTIAGISEPTSRGPDAIGSTVRHPSGASGSSTTRISVDFELRCDFLPAGVYAGVRVTR